MPYRRNAELPDSVKHNLSAHARDIYRNAFNNAWEQYQSPRDRRDHATREETAHRVAWAAVKMKYHKRGDAWVPRP